MGRILLVGRLAVRDLKRRRVEAVLLLLAVMAATTTLTLGLVLRDAASDPYQNTRERTNGPDVVVSSGPQTTPAELEALTEDPDVTVHSGPFPVTGAKLDGSDVQVMGRDTATAPVDQPEIVDGEWVRSGGIVVEASFANAKGIRVGNRTEIGDRPVTVVGLAVTAASPPWPGTSCIVWQGCASGVSDETLGTLPPGVLRDPGLVWLTREDAQGLDGDPVYLVNLKLADPNQAQAFADRYISRTRLPPRIETWNYILEEATETAGDSQIILMIGAWLLGLLAVASLSVLVGGRMADQTRRVGLLKAVGGTPRLVAAVLLAEYVLVSLVAAAAGLVTGMFTAPLLTERSAGLVGTAGTPSLTLATIGVVAAVAIGVAVAATLVPALRAARVSTVKALADSARPPRRTAWLIRFSARMPVPLLLALRLAARRPRRAVLATASIAITVSGIFVVLILNAFLADPPAGEFDAAQVASLRRVLFVWAVVLLCLAAVNAVVITLATVLDNRHASALTRALGATPREVSAAMAAAQVIPALLGALLGIFPCGYLLFAAIMVATGGNSDRATLPSLWQLAVLVVATVGTVAALTALPARYAARRPVTETL